MQDPLVSIIIDNYNYGRFLADAITSALGQTYPRIEVIVVDDGSTDNSWEVIARFAPQVKAVLKENGGQASAFNAGFNRSSGEVVLFLDADDMLHPRAVEEAVRLFSGAGVAKVHWRMWDVYENGARTGKITPGWPLAEGDLRDIVSREGPSSYVSAPASGNAWSRRVLEHIFPIPEPEFRAAADTYLFALDALFGIIKKLDEPHGYYRIHDRNNSRQAIDKRTRLFLWRYDLRCQALWECMRDDSSVIFGQPQTTDPDSFLGKWKRHNAYYAWVRLLHQVTQEMAALIPEGESFIRVDNNQWGDGQLVGGRHDIPFMERDGEYWGLPPDDESAIREIERLRSAGAGFIVFGWPAFWWLDIFPMMRLYLRTHFRCLAENERVVVFDLHTHLRPTHEALLP
jgi:glycosyltransferase involved in cell wall biosynthesis